MTANRRLRIAKAHNWQCCICGQVIDSQKQRWDVDHIIPLEISGDDSDKNLAPAHYECHKQKTITDKKDIAKCKRIEQKYHNTPRRKKPIPGSKGSQWKKTIDGRVVKR